MRVRGYCRILVATGLSIPAALTGQEQAAVLVATVTAHDTGEPLPNATILIDPGGHSAITNAHGHVRIGGIPPGSHTIAFGALGYQTEHAQVEFIARAVVEAEVELLVAPIQLDGVTGSVRIERHLAMSGFYDREKYYPHGTFLRSEEIERIAGRGGRLVNALRGIRGVRIELVTGPASTSYRVTTSRGQSFLRGSCTAQIYLDGMPYTGLDIPLPWVAGMEVYPSPALAPPLFSSVTGCGPIIVLWTR